MSPQKTKPSAVSKSNYQSGRTKTWIFYLLLFIAGTGVGYAISLIMEYVGDNKTKHAQTETKTPSNDEFKEMRVGGYQFTNPLLDCDNYNPSVLPNHVKLKASLREYVDNAIKYGVASEISVYFRSLNNGPWIGINEDALYTPASLLKVPVMIAMLKKAQTDPFIMSSKLYFSGYDDSYNRNIVDGESLEADKAYTVEELLEYMIVYSDNNAKELLLKMITDDEMNTVMADLGVNVANKDLSKDFISVKEYSSFFRILYNASYLNREMSEYALKLLSRSVFNKGIPNNLPTDMLVAHKYGERAYFDADIKQLHDCGIVYLPNSPYLLCVMTRGKNFDELITIIAEISEIVYKNLSQNEP